MPRAAEGASSNSPAAAGVIIPAAGTSRRFGTDKLTLSIAGRSVIARSVDLFLGRGDVDRIVIACDPQRMPDLQGAIATGELESSRLQWCKGGDCRARSVLAGLQALRTLETPPTLVAIHDAARPAASPELVNRVFTAAATFGAAVPAIPVVDTVKQVDSEGFVASTLRRSELVAVQTPQVMRLDWLVDAYERCPIRLEEVTDDVQLLEVAGYRVRVVEGEATNLKLTHPDDLERLERILGREDPYRPDAAPVAQRQRQAT